MIEFALPDVGEGLTEAEIVSWHVVAGDAVEVNDILVEIETAKSVVELPSPAAGVIATVHVAAGTTVEVGTIIVSIDDDRTGLGGRTDAGTAAEPSDEAIVAPEEKPLVLVGTGPSQSVPRRRRLRARVSAAAVTAPSTPVARAANGSVRAKPPVRLLARQLGVDLSTVVPSAGGTISRDDVQLAASASSPAVVRSEPGGATRIPIKGVRKVTAAAMTRSAFTAPHVTEWLAVDVTATMQLLQRLRQEQRWAPVRLTPLVFVARAFLLAIRRFPQINASWDEQAQEIVVWHRVNLGIATATPRGLLVPNIKDSDTLDLTGLALAIDTLVDTARAGKASPKAMSNGTITITNIGALGVDAGTPILNPGEAAILALGAIRDVPWVVDGQIVPRKVTQLALSFDHRLVDGELGSQVLAETARLLRDPGETFLYV